MTDLSYQLYSSRNWPLADTLSMLAGIGYKEVEGYGGVFGDVPALKGMLADNGLTMTSAHFGVDELESDIVGCVALARDLGVSRVFAPYLTEDKRPTDLAGWDAFAARLAAIKGPIEAAGFTFGWHNHDFELVDLGGGRMPLDVIVDAGIGLELDLGWVQFAGLDPVGTIRRYGSKVHTVHIKDRAPMGEKEDEDGWADVGTGIMDWSAIHAACQAEGISHYVIEHDNPNDHARFAEASLAHISGL